MDAMTTGVTEMTDEDLAQQAAELIAERDRRATRADAVRRTDEMCLAYLLADGREQGDPWVEPMGIVGAYPTGWVAANEGTMWAATMPGIICPPSETSHGWEEHSGEILPFWQPGPYSAGDRVRDAGRIWVAQSDVDGQRPSEYPGGWTTEA